MITADRARQIRHAQEIYEAERKRFDPRRFSRGGSYTPQDIAEIERRAEVRSPTNEERGQLEVYEFMTNPPDKFYAFYSDDMRHIKTFMGEIIGDIVHRGAERRPMGGRVVSVRVRGINGATYAGTCNMSSGTYCLLKRTKDSVVTHTSAKFGNASVGRSSPMPSFVPDIDHLDDRALGRFWSTYRVAGASTATKLFGTSALSRPSKSAQTLAAYAIARSSASSLRREAKYDQAATYEHAMKLAFERLPSDVRGFVSVRGSLRMPALR